MSKTEGLRWYGKYMAGIGYYMERDDRGRDEQLNSHCLACAYAEVISRYGGDCDLRGLARYGFCYQHLAVLVRQERGRRLGRE